MTSQWNTKGIGKNLDQMQSGLLDEEVVILIKGKNSFDDRIYAFLKIILKDLMRMQSAIQAGEQCNPSDFGTVVAAGKGDPPASVTAEIVSTYKFVNTEQGVVQNSTAPPEKKAWDEY